MNCRTLRRKSAWSCAINMCWDTNRAIIYTTRGGGRSRSSCAPPRDSHPSLLTPRPAITRRLTETFTRVQQFGLIAACLLLATLFTAGGSLAQIPIGAPPPPPPPGQEGG